MDSTNMNRVYKAMGAPDGVVWSDIFDTNIFVILLTMRT